jgi:hypothetical protein
MMCDVRTMNTDDCANAFVFLSKRLERPDTAMYYEDRWLCNWTGFSWRLDANIVGVDKNGIWVRPHLYIDFYPDTVKAKLLRYDAAILLEPSGSTNPYDASIVHRDLALLILKAMRKHGAVGARLSDHLPITKPRLVESTITVKNDRIVRVLRWLNLLDVQS